MELSWKRLKEYEGSTEGLISELSQGKKWQTKGWKRIDGRDYKKTAGRKEKEMGGRVNIIAHEVLEGRESARHLTSNAKTGELSLAGVSSVVLTQVYKKCWWIVSCEEDNQCSNYALNKHTMSWRISNAPLENFSIVWFSGDLFSDGYHQCQKLCLSWTMDYKHHTLLLACNNAHNESVPGSHEFFNDNLESQMGLVSILSWETAVIYARWLLI